ncbi:chaB domain-containing protein [Ditylenchus destructor]|nr:chaB domain-containing protein [Ditylenchus destructor]
MPLNCNSDLPERIRENLPEHAQNIYREAYNSAWEYYEDHRLRRGEETREQTADKIAWAVVKNRYHMKPGGTWEEAGSGDDLTFHE